MHRRCEIKKKKERKKYRRKDFSLIVFHFAIFLHARANISDFLVNRFYGNDIYTPLNRTYRPIEGTSNEDPGNWVVGIQEEGETRRTKECVRGNFHRVLLFFFTVPLLYFLSRKHYPFERWRYRERMQRYTPKSRFLNMTDVAAGTGTRQFLSRRP